MLVALVPRGWMHTLSFMWMSNIKYTCSQMHDRTKSENFCHLQLSVQLSSSNQFIIYNTKYITSYFTLLSITNNLVYFITGIFHSHLLLFLLISHWEGVINFGANYSFSEKEQPITKINYHFQSTSLFKHSPFIFFF